MKTMNQLIGLAALVVGLASPVQAMDKAAKEAFKRKLELLQGGVGAGGQRPTSVADREKDKKKSAEIAHLRQQAATLINKTTDAAQYAKNKDQMVTILARLKMHGADTRELQKTWATLKVVFTSAAPVAQPKHDEWYIDTTEQDAALARQLQQQLDLKRDAERKATASKGAVSSKSDEIVINGTIIRIQKGDITQCVSDAIVNAANPQLLDGGGVCGAIFTAAGNQQLQGACNKIPCDALGVRCPVGQARLTKSFNLKTRGINHIIHAVGPDCNKITDPKQQDILLTSAYSNSLRVATEHGVTSIAFPFISSAIYAFPKPRAAKIALQANIEWLKANKTSIKVVNFMLFSDEDYNLFCSTLKDITGKK